MLKKNLIKSYKNFKKELGSWSELIDKNDEPHFELHLFCIILLFDTANFQQSQILFLILQLININKIDILKKNT